MIAFLTLQFCAVVHLRYFIPLLRFQSKEEKKKEGEKGDERNIKTLYL